jgi:hypothetical protein
MLMPVVPMLVIPMPIRVVPIRVILTQVVLTQTILTTRQVGEIQQVEALLLSAMRFMVLRLALEIDLTSNHFYPFNQEIEWVD